ncbi:hypothetical protein ABTZ46_16385 [Nocardioides sp. NPDC126508]
MKTIEDLRTTLGAHADHAGDPVARSVAVHKRIRRARTRRAGAVAAVAAAVIAAAGAIVLAPSVGHLPVAGMPRQVEALHFTYELADAEVLEVGADRHQLDVPAPSDDRQWGVVVRGADLGTGTATVFIDDEPVLRISGDERSALYQIPGPADGDITVKVSGASGGKVVLGIYERTGAIEGRALSDDGLVFPATYGGAKLIGGEFGDPDDTTVRYVFRAGDRPVMTAPVCLDPTGTFEVSYQIDGKEFGSGDCDEQWRDPAAPDLAIGSLLQPDQLSPGRHTVTAVATRRDGSTTPSEDAALHLGIAVYELGGQTDLGDMKIDEITEHDGRRWQVDRVIPISKTRAFSTEVATGDQPALFGYLACGGSASAHATSQELGQRAEGSTAMDSTGGCGYTVGDELLAYDTYDIALDSATETFDGALVIYRPVD